MSREQGQWRHQRLERPGGAYLRLSVWQPAAEPAVTASLLLLTGRSECVEKYAEIAADMAARGLQVLALDWRGQGGSSRDLPNRLKGHIDRFDTYLDDLDAALAILGPQVADMPFFALAHSMGGHLLLRHAAERPCPFKALLVSAPMLGIHTAPFPEPLARLLAAAMVARGRAADYAPGQLDWAEPDPPFHNNRLTSDPVRFLAGHACYTADPTLALGGATWGWLDAAFRSMAHLLAPGMLERIAVPVLLMSALADRIVRPDRHRQATARLSRGTLKTYPGARHELLMEADPIRNQVLADIDTFLLDQGAFQARHAA